MLGKLDVLLAFFPISDFLCRCSVVSAFGNYSINSAFGAGGEIEVYFLNIFFYFFFLNKNRFTFFFGHLQSKIQLNMTKQLN